MINFILAVLMISIFIPVGIYFTKGFNKYEQFTIMKILVFALVMRLGLVIVFSVFMPNPGTLAPDSGTYVRIGKRLADSWNGIEHSKRELYKLYQTNNYGYYWMCGGIFYIFGQGTNYAPAFINAFLGIFSILLLMKLLSNWFSWKIIRNFTLISSFMPSLILWQAIPLKDTVVFFLVTVSFYNYITFLKNNSLLSLFFVLLPIFPVYTIRYYLAFLIIGSIFISLFLFTGELSLKRIFRSILVGVVVVLGLFASGTGTHMLNQWNKEANVKQMESYRKGLTYSNAAIHTEDSYHSSTDIIIYLPHRTVTFLFAPFPWQIRNVRMISAFIEMPFWWYLFVFVIIGIKYMITHKYVRDFLPIIIYAIFLTLLYSLVTGNMGTGYRLRAQVLPFYFMMGAVGLAVRKAKKLGVSTDFILNKNLREKNTTSM